MLPALPEWLNCHREAYPCQLPLVICDDGYRLGLALAVTITGAFR